jgi:hypothetical protein
MSDPNSEAIDHQFKKLQKTKQNKTKQNKTKQNKTNEQQSRTFHR